jgi:glycosyltransferase involved in cell wall biosynthesis
MMPKPAISVIIPTRNSAATLGACLRSVQAQTEPVELIVVDRDSTDQTVPIAKTFTPHVFNHGPERSAQRNFGAGAASGKILLFIDSDMELSPEVAAQTAAAFRNRPELVAVTIPETSFGQGFWAKCKTLERSMYAGVDWMESPRAIPATVFARAGGYNEHIAGGEDWELTQRLRALGPVGRITAPIRHNEGRLTLRGLVKKRLYYASGFARVYATRTASPAHDALRLYGRLFSRPGTIIRHPLIWCGTVFMKSTELSASTIGYALAKRHQAGEPHA